MVMLSQMQFNIQYVDALELPAGELVNIFEQLTFIRITEIIDDAPVLLFKATFLKGFNCNQNMEPFYS